MDHTQIRNEVRMLQRHKGIYLLLDLCYACLLLLLLEIVKSQNWHVFHDYVLFYLVQLVESQINATKGPFPNNSDELHLAHLFGNIRLDE